MNLSNTRFMASQRLMTTVGLAVLIMIGSAAAGLAANKETVQTTSAYFGQNSVRVDIYGHNEVSLLEYFNLLIFDDTRLEFVSIAADRGSLWYSIYPTQIVGDHIYVHGAPPCMSPDLGEPGSPLFHLIFNVKSGAAAGLAGIDFATEGILWDGDWNDCSGYAVSPTPDYYNGGINILGHAGLITVGHDSVAAGEQAVVDVYLHNDLDVFEYFNQLHFDDSSADVDSIVAMRGVLHYGNYPTQVSGDTIFVHGWAGNGECFDIDAAYPGAALYRIYFTVDGSTPSGTTLPLTFLDISLLWNHWVGCDLTTTDSFDAANGWIYVLEPTGVAGQHPVEAATRLGVAAPNPTSGNTVVSYFLDSASEVTVSIYDIAGRKIKTLEQRFRTAGLYETAWDGTNLDGQPVSSGIYFYRLQAGSATFSKKLVVIK